MGKKHLSEDEIKYIVSAESSQAQQEIHELTKATKELKKEEKERRKAMIELEAQGKKGTKEYQNLEKECKSLSKQVSDNNKRIGALTRSLDINAMTGRQLKKVAKELAATLDDMSEAADPEEYAKLSRRLGDVRKRMAELKNSGKNVKQEFDLTKTAVSKLKAAVAAFILVKLGEYLKDVASKVYSTRKEFAKYEAVLRNTLQSQEKAAAAMKLLQQLAADTPASLQEWTEAYIKLVNRGIKPTTAELTNIGDLAASQGKSVDQLIEAILDAMTGENERLKEFGIKASKDGNKVKYTFRGITTEVQNSEEAIKSYLLSLGQLDGISGSMATQMKELEGMESNLKDTLDNLWNTIGKRTERFFKKGLSWATNFVSDITKVMEPLSDTFENQMEKVVNLERELPGMAARYDELAGKVNRNAEEQKELNTLIERISSIVPSAVSEWDQYGNVISVNTQKVNDYLAAEKARLNFVHREEIKSLRTKKEEAKAEMESLMLQNKRGKVWAGGTGYGNTKDEGMREMTDAEKAANAKRIAELNDELTGISAQLDKISGDGIDKIVKERIKSQEEATEAQKRFNNMNKSMLSAWLKDEKNAADQYREIAQEIYNKRFPLTNTTTTDKSDPNAVALKNQNSDHEAEVNEIRLAGREKQQTEEEINLAILKSDQAYYNKRIKLLEQFKATATKSAKKADYQKQIVDAKSKLIDTEVSLEKQKVSAVERLRQDDLEKEKAVTLSQKMYLTNELAAKHLTQEQFEMMTLSLTSASAETRLAIEQRYLNDINDLELKNGKLKADAVKQANTAVLSAEQEATNARAAIQAKMNDMLKDFKNQFKLTTVEEDLQIQMKVLEASYEARKKLAEKEGLDMTELYASYLKAREQLTQDSENRINQIKMKYGLLSQKQQFQIQLQELNGYLNSGILSQEEYEKAVLNMKRDYYKKQFDTYSNLFSGAIQALQQAEMDNVDAKYDAEIEAAQGNTQEVERLEKEKAQKKLDIQKKYADVNFAIKVSQIIADTAVSIMKAFADLGPIGGAVAAALMGVTGAAQIASANAERNKIKNMTLSGGTSSKGSGQRVATGREDGGKIDVRRAQDGKLFAGADYDPDARGFIDKPTVIVGEGPAGQSKEWVASNAAVENPTVGPILDMIDKSQQAGTIRTLDLNQVIRSKMAGFSSGGSIAQTPPATGTPNDDRSGVALPPELMEKFAHAIIDINEKGVKAPIVLSDIERKQALRDQSREIGSKG